MSKGQSSVASNLAALVVTPPFSPNTANPLLGPAILKAHCESKGLPTRTTDLNIRYIANFSAGGRDAGVVGDHNADEAAIQLARQHFLSTTELPEVDASRVPSCDDPNSSLVYSFDELYAAVEMMARGGYWRTFFAERIFDEFPQPAVLGISIMGPIQVPLAMLLARLSKEHWKGTTVVVGGSHITLLAPRISRDPRYGADFDFFVPGHSEDVFANLVAGAVDRTDAVPAAGVLRAGESWQRADNVEIAERLPPVFEEEELSYYRDRGDLTLPIQIGRGCVYGRCTYCTYPVVESFERVEVPDIAKRFLPALFELEPKFISVKDSLFTLPSMADFGRVMDDLASGTGWSATTKVRPAMTRERMGELSSLGCRTLEMGIETIHPDAQRFFSKREPLERIEKALSATLDAGISVVINMIYGTPHETIEDARRQMAWWQGWKDSYPDQVFGVHNLLQIDEGSPLAMAPKAYGIELHGSAPWSFTYAWNAPAWREEFQREIDETGGRAR